VPQTALGHDLRIKDLYTDLEIPELFVDHEDPDRYRLLSENVEKLFNQYSTVKAKLQKGYLRYDAQEKRNPQLLRSFLEENHPEWLR
jgi:hypothetical protein